VVQGVGFRPFAYGEAVRLGLAGHVVNEPGGVEIEVEGAAEKVQAFVERLRSNAPVAAKIHEIITDTLTPICDSVFEIRGSSSDGERAVFLGPDLATCDECLNEMRDPQNRRFGYAFTNCTNCGPRYTIIRDLPYDRARTTMAEFEMCAECRAEYEDPTNRRFHAEATCCPKCGPHLDCGGTTPLCQMPTRRHSPAPVTQATERLAAGQILAVKGIGGFHLACDAANAEAVQALRQRKQRDQKPFAIMVRDLAALKTICHVPDEAVAALTGPERPIVLLEKRDAHGLAEGVAPRSASFGVMLPYTPVHHLLMDGPFRALVMTSGNLSDEPIAYTNEDAAQRLDGLADAYLTHNRAIHVRTDDSVARVIGGRLRFVRRSRGYAPFPVGLPFDAGHVLAVGPELNSTVCVTRGDQAFLSHHVGDLNNLAAYEGFQQAVDHMKDIMAVTPQAVACDLHPQYLSTRYARESGLPLIQVQHHHAHVASVLAEAGRADKVIGAVFDGIGWGDDNTAWGGEFVVCDLAGYTRVGHLEPVPQPGGDAAAKKTARMAYAYWLKCEMRNAKCETAELVALSNEEKRIIRTAIEKEINCPMTSSMGRLFDAASALLGVCQANTFHSQAPMELEAAAARARDGSGGYPVPLMRSKAGLHVVSGPEIIRAMVEDFLGGSDAAECAARFHNTVADATLDVCELVRRKTGLATVVLSGGVFANAFLVERLVPLLERAGFEVLMNATVPAGDGGVSLGQAAVAAWRLRCV